MAQQQAQQKQMLAGYFDLINNGTASKRDPPITTEQTKSFHGAPNPSGYTGEPSSTLGQQISTTKSQQSVEDIYQILAKIERIEQRQEEIYKLIHDWIVYNPIEASHSRFINDMIRGKEELLPGPVPANQLKESMNSDDVNPLKGNE